MDLRTFHNFPIPSLILAFSLWKGEVGIEEEVEEWIEEWIGDWGGRGTHAGFETEVMCGVVERVEEGKGLGACYTDRHLNNIAAIDELVEGVAFFGIGDRWNILRKPRGTYSTTNTDPAITIGNTATSVLYVFSFKYSVQ